jgi:hypothetical protein
MEKLKLIQELFECSKQKENIKNIFTMILEKVTMETMRSYDLIEERDDEKLKAIYEKCLIVLDSLMDNLQEIMIGVVDNYFTIEEIEESIKFYKSSAGQKITSKDYLMVCQEHLKKWGEEFNNQLITIVNRELKNE